MSERRKLETALNKAASTPPPTLGQQSTFTLWHTTLRYDWTRTLLYFFLNWQLKGCTVWLTVLKGVMGFGLVLGFLIAEYARAAAWGPAAVAVGAVLSMRLRCPPITAKAD